MLFSVIVPIYNVEPYLRTCVDSVLSQTFSDFELILVDDGSPDGCPGICDEYAEKDTRVRVIHKPNGGLVSARKAGISIAEGEYVLSLDGDDWLTDGCLEEAHRILERSHPDLISFALSFVSEKSSETDEEPIPEGLYDAEAIKETIYPNMLCNRQMKHLHFFLCGKVFRRELLKPCQLEMDERISMGEDVFCLIPTYLRAESVFVSRFVGYAVRAHASSMSRKFNPKHFEDITLGLKKLRKIADDGKDFLHQSIDRYGAFLFFVIMAIAASVGGKGNAKVICDHWNPEFERCFRDADFGEISAKSKITMRLLKRKRIRNAYRFLRFCELLKGNK